MSDCAITIRGPARHRGGALSVLPVYIIGAILAHCLRGGEYQLLTVSKAMRKVCMNIIYALVRSRGPPSRAVSARLEILGRAGRRLVVMNTVRAVSVVPCEQCGATYALGTFGVRISLRRLGALLCFVDEDPFIVGHSIAAWREPMDPSAHQGHLGPSLGPHFVLDPSLGPHFVLGPIERLVREFTHSLGLIPILCTNVARPRPAM